MVAQKIKILSKRTVHGSAKVALSDTKQDLTVPRGKQRCVQNGPWNICKLLYPFKIFVLATTLIFSSRHDFFYGLYFEKLSLRNR